MRKVVCFFRNKDEWIYVIVNSYLVDIEKIIVIVFNIFLK